MMIISMLVLLAAAGVAYYLGAVRVEKQAKEILRRMGAGEK